MTTLNKCFFQRAKRAANLCTERSKFDPKIIPKCGLPGHGVLAWRHMSIPVGSLALRGVVELSIIFGTRFQDLLSFR